MTLIAVASSRYHSILASDRRLTANGRLVDSSSNKAIALIGPSYQLAFGFTGLAEAGGFRTRDFLRDELARLAPASSDLRVLVLQLQASLSAVFKRAPLSRLRDTNRPLAVALVGCIIGGGKSHAVYGSIMNFDHFGSGSSIGDFQVQLSMVAPGVAFLGALPAVSQDDKNDVNDFIRRDAPHCVIAERLAHRIRIASKNPAAGGTVGEKVSWISINRQTLDVQFGQYPQSTLESYSPTFIAMDAAGVVSTAEGISVIGPEPKYKLPAFERGLNCPCGSGVQYRRCHGRNFQRVDGVASPLAVNDDSLLAFPPGYETWGN